MTPKNFKLMFAEPREKLGYLFWQINMLWIRSVNQNLSETDITHTQLITLASILWLNSEMEEVNQKDLVEAIKVDRMLISKMVTKLEEEGLVERVPSKKDARATAVKPTKKGEEKLKSIFPLMKKTEMEFFGKLGERKDELKVILQDFLTEISPKEHQQKNSDNEK